MALCRDILIKEDMYLDDGGKDFRRGKEEVSLRQLGRAVGTIKWKK